MNKKILGEVLILLIIVALGWFIYSRSSNSSLSNATTTPETQSSGTGSPAVTTNTPPKTVVKNPNTFPAIFNQAGSHQCTYEQVTPTTRSQNLIDIADGKMRGEFRSTTNGVTTANLMVYNYGTLYVWVEGKTIGTETVLKSIADLPTAIPKDLTSGSVLGSGQTVLAGIVTTGAKTMLS
jgi:hypothetical protein